MKPQDFATILAQYPRLVLCGYPWAGKTPLSLAVHDRPVIHTDNYIEGFEWDDAPGAIVADCHSLRSYLLEGVRAPWALRAGLVPDAVLWLENPATQAQLSTDRRGIGLASRKVLDQWLALGLGCAYLEREIE